MKKILNNRWIQKKKNYLKGDRKKFWKVEKLLIHNNKLKKIIKFQIKGFP